ncbi:MAG: transferase hexapeptide repeat containing protein [Firmicutes bacterium]|nr:transferase hexapeptide repeat containing protein [Bacillota bacterium]
MIRKLCCHIVLWLEEGWCWSKSIREIYRKYHNISIGYGTYGGAFDLRKIPSGTVFGRYCSIAADVWVFNGNHPKEYFSLHPLFYNPALGHAKRDMITRNMLYIGNDVWIGANAIILPGVTKIGDGAIIGAGSVVTKNIAPYQIVAGNPAKVINMRFKEEQQNRLIKLQWWDLEKDSLTLQQEFLEKNLININE